MKKLNHKLKKHDVGLVDSQTGKVIRTSKAIDVTDECNGEPVTLLYATAKRGPLCQIKRGCSSVHYFLHEIHFELERDSALKSIAKDCKMTTSRFIYLIQMNAP